MFDKSPMKVLLKEGFQIVFVFMENPRVLTIFFYENLIKIL